MQNRYQNDWTERSLFYNCRMFTEGFYHGQSYGELEPCIHIDRKSTRLNSSHMPKSRMPSSA